MTFGIRTLRHHDIFRLQFSRRTLVPRTDAKLICRARRRSLAIDLTTHFQAIPVDNVTLPRGSLS